MNYQRLIKEMPEEVYLRLKTASETGKWPDGKPLDNIQKTHCLQAVLAWQACNIEDKQHLMPTEDGNLIHQDKKTLQHQFKTQDEANETTANIMITRLHQA